ncbi:E3 ubiquitin-protein ligase APD2 [Citrus sinensis]|uniref:E3 ubiquitin-protein ligase APD2 n=1 Tax=Citrus sinensis TaxID=2711 RepID=A0ACB8IXJ0_CITSI|nr:E3 ubiquitin-protein ligase APD2 [Citrus sinensis]
MEEESRNHNHRLHESVPSSSISTSHSQENAVRQQQQSSGVSYRVNMSISDSSTRNDIWSCLFVLLIFWLFVTITMIFGVYGSLELQLGPHCSRPIHTNPLFVQSIKAQVLDRQTSSSLMLYGFHNSPPLDVEFTWTETHIAVVPDDEHEEWLYFLNKGSKVEISYNVKSPSSSPLSLVIARGSESLEDWIDHPSYPNTTLSWNIIYGSGKIQQKISKSSDYYIAVGNLNSQQVEVQLNFTMNALVYNTSKAYYRCSLGSGLCILSLDPLGTTSAILTSPGPTKDTSSAKWYVKLSYGPRWITYFAGLGVMTILMLLAFRYCNMCRTTSGDGTGFQATERGSQRAPLLSHKDDDLSSWGSSYDSVSHDEQDLEDRLPVNSLEGTSLNEGEINRNHRHLRVICCDAPRDCFFLPCGHCAACFACGTRIAEEGGTCSICRKKIKKVRKIFTV